MIEPNQPLNESFTFDDVIIEPAYSEVLPSEVSLQSQLAKDLTLQIPFLSAAMDTVTEHKMAIVMAQLGGLGIVHKNLPPEQQAEQVRIVKRAEAGMIHDPVTICPESTLGDVVALMAHHQISGVPVVEGKYNRLVGVITHRDVRFARDMATPVKQLMTTEVVTVEAKVSMEQAQALLHQHRIEKLPVVDNHGRCIALITVKDIERAIIYPDAIKDQRGRLKVGAAVGVGEQELTRSRLLVEAGCDVLVVDTAHGHSRRVLEQVERLKKKFTRQLVIAGNVATEAGARALADAGADIIKVGIGPGSICTTRVVAGVGVAQLSAVAEAALAVRAAGVCLIADGGIKYSGDIGKAIVAGADAVMIGSLLAGTDESPGETFLFQNRTYKSYRGMGSLAAMARGSADRYFQSEMTPSDKLVAEGVEGRVPYKGAVAGVVNQLAGGLRATMGYTGCATIQALQRQAKLRRLTLSGLRESHVHNVDVDRSAPNYKYG